MNCNLSLLAAPEHNSALRAFLMTWPGRFLATFVMILAVGYVKWPHCIWRAGFVIVAALAAYWPRQRVRVCLAAAIAWMLHRMSHGFSGHHMMRHSYLATSQHLLHRHAVPVLLTFSMAGLLLVLARKVGRKGIFACPVLSLLGVVSVLVGLGQWQLLPSVVRATCWELAILLSFSKWFMAYAINNVTARRPKPGTILENLSVLHPFWGGGQVPFGKGWSYIRRHEARDDERLAIAQIRALHLVAMVALIHGLEEWYVWLVKDIHSPFSYMMDMVHGKQPDRLVAALSLPVQFFKLLLDGYVWGNIVIVFARFAGYDLQQNMINPLFSHSIADFWNRWYFYFKELLVEFFFLPTFRRTAWLPEKARIFVATLMAAGFGNYIFHIYQLIAIIHAVGIMTYIRSSAVYAVYCFILGVGIGISQVMNPFNAPDGNKRRFKPHCCLGVIAFFCVVGLLGAEEPAMVLAQHTQLGILEYLHFYAYICHLA